MDNVAFVSENTFKLTKSIEIHYEGLMSSFKANDFNSDKRQKNFQPVQTITLLKYLLVEASNFKKFNAYAETRNWKFFQKVGNNYLYSFSS